MTYRMLVLPAVQRMAPEALQMVAALAEAGAVVVGQRFTGAAGLMTDPTQQKRFDELVSKVWNISPTDRIRHRHVFAGEAEAAL